MFGLFVLSRQTTDREPPQMTHEATRRVALMTLFTTCALLIALAVALGLNANAAGALRQALPVCVVAAIAFTVLLADPTGRAGR
jgi:hypothetical protein